MELTQLQISEIIYNYTSSSQGFVILQSLIMNSLMFHERELFVSENKDEQCNGFRSRRWYSHGFEFSLCIPRSRSGNFYPVLLGLIRNESEERARLFSTFFIRRGSQQNRQARSLSVSMVVPTANNRFPIWQTVVVMMSINGFAVIFPLTIWQSISMQPSSPPVETDRCQKKCKGVYTRLTGLEDSTESIKGLSI